MKLCCSLKWLSGILSESPLWQEKQDLSKHLLLEPYQDGILKSDVVLCLTSPSVYLSAYNILFPNDRVEGNSFESFIHWLAKKGAYVLEEDGTIVTDPMLAQDVPFREVSHSKEVVLAVRTCLAL